MQKYSKCNFYCEKKAQLFIFQSYCLLITFNLTSYYLNSYNELQSLIHSYKLNISSNNTRMQIKSYSVVCPECKRPPVQSYKTGAAFVSHNCHEDCGNIYWTLAVCPKCPYPESTVILQKPGYGKLITCKNCNFGMYLFLCPQKNCISLFYKSKQSYLMGLPLYCQNCKHEYKTISCHCGGRVTLAKDEQIIQGFTHKSCPICKKQIIYTICTQCFNTQYHKDPLQLGSKFVCTTCKKKKSYIPCPHCGRTTSNQKFHYCELYKCNYCDKGFEFSKCPYCSAENYHFTQKALQPARKCESKQCGGNYFVLPCHKCQEPVYFQDFQLGVGRQQDCPRCKTILKFYFCQTCKMFNSRDSKCFNIKCPKPQKIKSYSNQAKQKSNLQVDKKNQDYIQTECKLCYTNKSQLVNNTCGHVMMCQQCYKGYKVTKNNSNNLPCPICKKIGLYTKVIKYIYA